MATNKFFNNFSFAREQDLVEDLTIEAIKIYGHDIRYLPRTINALDDLYSEDPLSTFNDAAIVEVYVKNVEGFEGEGDLLTRFGLEIRDEITLTMARKRFDQIRSEKLITEVGYNYLNEDADTNKPSRQFLAGDHNTESIILEEGTANGYSILNNRPMEGDHIFIPMVGKTFEIKFVEHEQLFYQMGRLQTYDLRCEVVNHIEDRFILNILDEQILLDGEEGNLLLEESGTLLQEFLVESKDTQANNNVFTSEINTDGIIDFSESDPWSEGRRV